MNANVLMDTNILVYAFDGRNAEKWGVAKKLLEKCFRRELNAAVSVQNLNEFCNVMTKKVNIRILPSELLSMLGFFTDSGCFKLIHFSVETIERAVNSYDEGKHYWDCLLAATMLENGITTVYTENTKGFERIEGIKAVNPFK